MKHRTNRAVVILAVLALVPRGEVRADPPDFISSDLSASLYYFFQVKAKKVPALVNTAAMPHVLAAGQAPTDRISQSCVVSVTKKGRPVKGVRVTGAVSVTLPDNSFETIFTESGKTNRNGDFRFEDDAVAGDPGIDALVGAEFWGLGAQLGGRKKVDRAVVKCVTTEMPANPDLAFVNGPSLDSDRYFLNLGSNATWDGTTLTSGQSTWSVKIEDKRNKQSVLEVTFDQVSGPSGNLKGVSLGDTFTGAVFPDPPEDDFIFSDGFASGDVSAWGY